MLVTREADYAIRCVLEVARQGRVSAARVAELQSISPTFLGKIVQSLARAGILTTRRGVGGGVSLAVPLEELSMLRVIEAVEGPLSINECVSNPTACPMSTSCPILPYLQQAQGLVCATFDVPLSSLLLEAPVENAEIAALHGILQRDVAIGGIDGQVAALEGEI